MSKKLFSILIVITIAASVLISANNFEKKDVYYLSLFNPQELTISAKQTVIGRAGWLACSEGLSQDWADHTSFELELYSDGVLINSALVEDGVWELVSSEPTVGEGGCLHVNEPYIAFWAYDFSDFKKPGDYEIHFRAITSVPLTDGFDSDNDGYMDIYNFDYQRVKIIHVVP